MKFKLLIALTALGLSLPQIGSAIDVGSEGGYGGENGHGNMSSSNDFGQSRSRGAPSGGGDSVMRSGGTNPLGEQEAASSTGGPLGARTGTTDLGHHSDAVEPGIENFMGNH